jgi:hypothetical protein
MTKISIYSTLFRLEANPAAFDIPGALANWAFYADEISIACGDEYSRDAVERVAQEHGYPVKAIRTNFDFSEDPFAYGKTENAAMQNCSGDLLFQQNFDERCRADRRVLEHLSDILAHNPNIGSFFTPVVNLYGSYDRMLDVGRKWYVHKSGYQRGPVNFGLKADGRPDYNKTSTDELIDNDGNLVPTYPLIDDLSIDSLRAYVARGMPITYHLGYVDFKERLERSLWWKAYWTNVTGDENKHPTSVEEIAARETKIHGLPLWESIR